MVADAYILCFYVISITSLNKNIEPVSHAKENLYKIVIFTF